MTTQERFAADWNMPLHEVERLVRLAKKAGKANEHYSNGDPTESYTVKADDKNACAKWWGVRVDEITEDIDKLAKRFGFAEVVYTGLFPTLKRGTQFVEIPY